jgi:hypothetical protein
MPKITPLTPPPGSLLKNGNLLRQRKNPDRLCMRNTLRALDFFASLHLTIFEQAANFEFYEQSAKRVCR